MKTRIISTDIWDDDNVFTLNIDTKLLYLILLTNPYIGQNRFYKINDRQLSTFSGLNSDQIQKCKKDLEQSRMVFFKENYVCITGAGFVESFYKGSKNEIAKNREIGIVPKEILEYFNKKLDTLSIPYQYPMDTTLNNKLETINNKDSNLEGFEKFYESFPSRRKGGKKLPWAKWQKLDLEDQALVLIDVPKRAAEHHDWLKDEGSYIPAPEVYLNKQQWLMPIVAKISQKELPSQKVDRFTK